MSGINEWLQTNGLEDICGDILSFVPMPLLAGRVVDDGLIIEVVNDHLIEALGRPIDNLPDNAENLFSGIPGPKDMAPLEEAARGKGWSRKKWSLVSGEAELDLFCWGDGGEHFAAFYNDKSSSEVYSRLMKMKERIFYLMGVFDVKGMIPQMLSSLVEHLEVDWAGIFVWDSIREVWVLSIEDACPAEFSQETYRNAVSFARRVSESRGGPFGHQFGGLAIQEGYQWWVPWRSEAGDCTLLMAEAGFESLFAGVLLTGSSPAVLLCLSRKPGGFAKINRETLEVIWPVFQSLSERNRAISGITKLFTRDSVTGLYAQNMMNKIMKIEMSRSRRYRYPLSVVTVKVSNIGEIREKGGIEATDETIQKVSRSVLKSVRNVDIGARLDDDSILILLPHTDIEGAGVVSGRIVSQARGLSPFQNTPLIVDSQFAMMDDECLGPDELLAKLGLTWPKQPCS